jgi:hypothetical protein
METALAAGPPTEVEVRFIADGDGTRLELEHRGRERVGAEAREVRDAYGAPQGWITTLNVFAAHSPADRASRGDAVRGRFGPETE